VVPGSRSAIFKSERHHVPLPLGGEELDIDVDHLVHLGPRIVPPPGGQGSPRSPSSDLRSLPMLEKAIVDTHPCKIGTRHGRLEAQIGRCGPRRFVPQVFAG
jgi:hypothetical protein